MSLSHRGSVARRVVVGLILAVGFLAAPVSVSAANEDEPTEEESEDTDEEEPEEAAEDEPPEIEEPRPSLRERTTPTRRTSSGLGFELALGPLAVFRRMNFSGSNREIPHEPEPYFGGVLELTQTVFEFEKMDAAFVVRGEGGFASAKNSEVERGLGRQLVTEYTYGHIEGVLERSMTDNLDVRVGLGYGLTSFTIEPNPNYTGHRYSTLISSFKGIWWFTDDIRAGGGLTAFPVLSVNQSAGAYGKGTGFGVRLEGEGSYRFLQPIEDDLAGMAEVSLRYTFGRFRTSFPGADALGQFPAATDTQHALLLFVRYAL